MFTGFDVSTLGLNCLFFFPPHFHAPKLIWSSRQFSTKTAIISDSSQILSGLTPESRGDSAHGIPCSECVWLEARTWLSSDKSGHKVALLPFLSCLQGQSPDLHVNSATTSLFGIPETGQNNKKKTQWENQVCTEMHSEYYTQPNPDCVYKVAWLKKNDC